MSIYLTSNCLIISEGLKVDNIVSWFQSLKLLSDFIVKQNKEPKADYTRLMTNNERKKWFKTIQIHQENESKIKWVCLIKCMEYVSVRVPECPSTLILQLPKYTQSPSAQVF